MDSLNTYELAYNTACTYIGQKDYRKAEKLLNTAKSTYHIVLSFYTFSNLTDNVTIYFNRYV